MEMAKIKKKRGRKTREERIRLLRKEEEIRKAREKEIKDEFEQERKLREEEQIKQMILIGENFNRRRSTFRNNSILAKPETLAHLRNLDSTENQ